MLEKGRQYNMKKKETIQYEKKGDNSIWKKGDNTIQKNKLAN